MIFTSCNVSFFFNDTATTEIYTLSLHDALPILRRADDRDLLLEGVGQDLDGLVGRSEEHTSELQSPDQLVCRLLLEKKKNMTCVVCPKSPKSFLDRVSTGSCCDLVSDQLFFF